MKKIVVLFLLFVVNIASITAKDIKGRVSNDKSTMRNVSIYLKNQPNFSVTTNNEGEFVLSLKGMEYLEEDRIVFSHIGYETKEYRIKELSDSIFHEVVLVESLVILDQVVVMGRELSRREKKERKISIIKQFKEQAKIDFIVGDRTYKVVSDFEVARDTKKIFYNKLIGEYKEQIGVLEDKRDSICLTYTDMNHYIDNDIDKGLEEMSDRFIDNNVVSKKRKENKRALDSLFYKMVLTDSLMLKQMLQLHKSFWHLSRNAGVWIQEIDDNPKKWEIIETSDQTTLRYKTKNGLLGIVKQIMITDFIINPITYSLERVVDDSSLELNIPFGYKLPPDALMLLNIINAGGDSIDKYKVRHLYIDVTLSAIYKKTNDSKHIDEMGFDTDISIIDTKKRNINGESNVLVKVLSVEDN